MSQISSQVLTDFNSSENIPSFYRNILGEQTDQHAALRKIIEKVQLISNDKSNLCTYGIVVDSIDTAYPQTTLNQLMQQISGATSFKEYKVVLFEDGMSLDDPSCTEPTTPHDFFKYMLSKYYTKASNEVQEPKKGQVVRITFTDDQRSDGWITEVLTGHTAAEHSPAASADN